MKTKNGIIAVFGILLVCACLLGLERIRQKSPTDVFYENIESIVEVKAVTEAQESYGTAVFADSNGTLVTNAHVVTVTRHGEQIGCDEIYIRFAQEEAYVPVELLALDEQDDLALLRCETGERKIKGIAFGDDEKADFGDTVYAIGNTMNTGLAVSQGIISIPDIRIEYEGKNRECIQADITISNGNSGGALLDASGKLIGITSFRLKDTAGNVVYGYCYSVPLRIVKAFLEKNT